ncbi:MAG TPA: hypothetical protein VJZ76_10865 [Thermoanaerobaculia bacterium]|nr:hypothetical protein [Thermoanaerobaculia bacterium]
MKGDELFLPRSDPWEDRFAAYDYAWMVTSNVIGSTDRSWRWFRAGYGAGGEIGKRRYAISTPSRHERLNA